MMLDVDVLFENLANDNILLLTNPLKPLGRDITSTEYQHIEDWLAADAERLLLVDAVYLLENKVNQVIIMHSLSKAWCLPNHLLSNFFQTIKQR